MWIKEKDGNEVFFEIKYEQDLNDEDVIKQIAIQKKWCDFQGKKHLIRTDKDIRKNEILLENLKDLLPYLLNNGALVEIDRHKIISQIKAGKQTLKDLNQSQNMNLPRLYEAIASLICLGEIKANIDVVYFGLETEVWMGETEGFD